MPKEWLNFYEFIEKYIVGDVVWLLRLAAQKQQAETKVGLTEGTNCKITTHKIYYISRNSDCK